MRTIGSPLVAGSPIYVVQSGSKLTSFWPDGHIRILVKAKTGGALIDSGDVQVFSREYGQTYSSFDVNLAAGSEQSAAITTSIDSAITLSLSAAQAIREAQSTAVGLAYPVIAKAEGLSVLDAVQGIATFITVTLFDNWEINSLLSGGKFVLTGGNLIRADNADPFMDNPLVTYFAFFSQSGTVTTVNTGSGVTPQDKTDIISGVWGYTGA